MIRIRILEQEVGRHLRRVAGLEQQLSEQEQQHREWSEQLLGRGRLRGKEITPDMHQVLNSLSTALTVGRGCTMKEFLDWRSMCIFFETRFLRRPGAKKATYLQAR